MRKVKVIKADKFLDTWSKLAGFRVTGLALFEVIIIRRYLSFYDKSFNHEKIHIAQQRELLYLPFLLLYAAHYLWLRRKMSHKVAYRHIVFEKEAYDHEYNLSYDKSRKRFAWLKYL